MGAIDRGILALVGIEAGDSDESGARLLRRVLTYRIFPDDAGKMNLDLQQIGGGLLLVPQFTLVADTRKGTRPSFSDGATPEQARRAVRRSWRRPGRPIPPPAAGSSAPTCRSAWSTTGR